MRLIVLTLFAVSYTSTRAQYLTQQASVCSITAADTEGPYYVSGAPNDNFTVCSLRAGSARLTVKGRLTDGTCQTGLQGTLDVWQADSTGVYAFPPNYECRRKIATDPQGYFSFDTAMPGRYQMDGPSDFRPAHIHFKAIVPRYNTLTTQLYFKNDPFLGSNDACGRTCHSSDGTLVMPVTIVNGRSQVTWNIALRSSGSGGSGGPRWWKSSNTPQYPAIYA